MKEATPIPSTSMEHHRFHLLDGLRGVAAILVIFWHAPPTLFHRDKHSFFLAVDFFFSLSGFVLAFSYEKRLRERFTFKAFSIARVIRLYPICFLVTVLSIPLWFADAHHGAAPTLHKDFLPLIGMQLLLIPNYFFPHYSVIFPFDIPEWSLFFEFWCNLFYAGLVRTGLARTGMIIALVAIAFSCFLGEILHGNLLDSGFGSTTHQLWLGTLRVGLSFFAGILILRIYRKRTSHHQNRARAWRSLAAVFVTLALVVAMMSPWTFMRNSLFELFDAILLFPALIYMGALATLPKAATKLCVFLGDVSYPVYLLHSICWRLPYLSAFSQITAHHPKVALWMTVLISVVIAHFAAKYYDSPIRKYLRGKFTVSPAKPATPPVIATGS